MKQKVTVFFKDKTKFPMIIRDADNASVVENGNVLRIYKENKFCYIIPVENIEYSLTEVDEVVR